jgi:hypothetical protein
LQIEYLWMSLRSVLFKMGSAGFRLVERIEPTARREADLKYSIFIRKYSLFPVTA